MNIILIAPPSAGKGTLAKMISKNYQIPHISVGDLLREEIDENTDLGKSIKMIVERGDLVKDELLTELIFKRLAKEDCNLGYILDGYPRTVAQAIIYEDILTKLNKDIGKVIFLDIDYDLALKRMMGRVICSKCGASYNLESEELRPKKENVCDSCYSSLEKRDDDNVSTFKSRFENYTLKTAPLIDYYKEKNILKEVKIDSKDKAIDTYNKIVNLIDS